MPFSKPVKFFRPLPRDATLLIFAGSILLFGLMVGLFFGISADDAYIVARYARNFNAGYGIVFNLGEPINALTSPLHFLVLASLQKISTSVVESYKLASAFGVAMVLWWAATMSFPQIIHRTVFLALTLLSPFVVFWTVGGLETPLLLSLLTIITVLLCRLQSNSTAGASAIIVLSGLAFLTRYDSVLFLLPVVAYVLFRGHRVMGVWLVAILTLTVVVTWLVFSLYYFGDLLPTSFYTKSPLTQNGKSLIKGGFYVINFLFFAWVVFSIFYLRKTGKLGLRFSATAVLYTGLGLFFAYGVLAGTKHMMYNYRLFVPFLPVITLLVIKTMSEKVANAPTKTHLTAITAIVGFQFMLAVYTYFESQNPNLTLLWHKQTLANEIYEFSTAGARVTPLAEEIYRVNAGEIKHHWLQIGNNRPPRVFILPGGAMPYAYPEAYIYETLVSYRHHCSYVLFESADYLQLIYPATNEQYPAQVFEHRAQKWKQISTHRILVEGYAAPMQLKIDVYYQPNPARHRLPAKITDACA